MVVQVFRFSLDAKDTPDGGPNDRVVDLPGGEKLYGISAGLVLNGLEPSSIGGSYIGRAVAELQSRVDEGFSMTLLDEYFDGARVTMQSKISYPIPLPGSPRLLIRFYAPTGATGGQTGNKIDFNGVVA